MLAAPAADAAIHNLTSFEVFSGTNGVFTTTPPDITAPLNQSNSTAFIATTAGQHAGAISTGVPGKLNGDPGIVADFNAQYFRTASFSEGKISIFGGDGPSNGFILTNGLVQNLGFGATIAGASHFGTGLLARKSAFFTAAGGHYTSGLFLPGSTFYGQIQAAKTGYVGFKTGSYYGWLRVKVVDAKNSLLPAEVTLADKNGDGIYGAIGLASDHIKAGEVAPVPEPSLAALGGLGLLALGAAGLRELRRRRQQAAGN